MKDNKDIVMNSIEMIPNMLDALKEDPEIINALSKSEKQKFDVLNSIAINDKLPEEERIQAVHKIFETIDIGNQNSKDFNNRANIKSIITTICIVGLFGIANYAFKVDITTYNKLKNIGALSHKISKNISNIIS